MAERPSHTPPSPPLLRVKISQDERREELRVLQQTPHERAACPFKSVWQKAHMIPELQSPIPPARAASAFLSVWMLQQQEQQEEQQPRRGGKGFWDPTETGEMWQIDGHFHGGGKTAAKGVIFGLLCAWKRRIKMVGCSAAFLFSFFFFCLFFCVSSWSLSKRVPSASQSNLKHFTCLWLRLSPLLSVPSFQRGEVFLTCRHGTSWK